MLNQLYGYWPITRRPGITWPGGARLAFWVGINVEHYEVDQPGTTSIVGATSHLVPDPLNYGWRDYGPRVGIWRMAEVLDRYGLRASVLLNSDVCEHYPEIIEEGNRRGWAWLAHGKNNSRFQAQMSPEEERTFLSEIVGTIRRASGKQPKGWLGPALTETFQTPDLLREQGLSYVCDWCCDDQPFPLRTARGPMISLPYSIEINDICLFVGKTVSGPDFYAILVDQLEQLYEQSATNGLVMSIALHPFVVGQPFRLRYLAKFLEYATHHAGIWFATSDEIAEWYFANCYDQAVAELDRYSRRYGANPAPSVDPAQGA